MSKYLQGYTTKAQEACQWPNFARDALVFGVELEVEPRGTNSQRDVLSVLPDFDTYFCKDDGSLDAGVEIVTVPGTLEWHRDTFAWADVLGPLAPIAMSGSRTQRCGMHIHVNRRALSPLTLAKMYLFVNEPANLRFIETIAQRSNNRWATMAKKTWLDARGRSEMARHGRYQAMNHTGPTVEFRLFRGTIRQDRLMKNIEFVHALVTWCRGNSAADTEDWRKFARFAMAGTEWPNLAGFMVEMGVAP